MVMVDVDSMDAFLFRGILLFTESRLGVDLFGVELLLLFCV